MNWWNSIVAWIKGVEQEVEERVEDVLNEFYTTVKRLEDIAGKGRAKLIGIETEKAKLEAKAADVKSQVEQSAAVADKIRALVTA